MQPKKIILILVPVALVIVLFQSLYIVDQTETAIVLQFGRPVGEASSPGLHFKKPFIQQVTLFDYRVLEYDAPPEEILTADKKNMVLDNYTKWRIKSPLTFYKTVRNEQGANARLGDIIYAQLRVALGRYTLQEIVAEKRAQIMEEVINRSSELIEDFGIEVVDVRIKRTDLPAENERAIFGRMRTEREREAKEYRSKGQEESAKIRSTADKERTILLADAERQAAVLRGEGEGEATRIYAEALKQSPDFYAFKRSLEAYKKSFNENTRVIITPSSDYLKYMN